MKESPVPLSAIVGAIVRFVLAASGGAAALSQDETQQLVGALVMAIALSWSVAQKVRAAKPKA